MIPQHIREMLEDHARGSDRVRSSKHAAAIIHRGHILSLGQNRLKTHPMMYKFSQNHNKVFLHAEIDAIVRAINLHGNDVLASSHLYVLRLDRANHVASSKPCEVCQRAIDAFGLKAYWSS